MKTKFTEGEWKANASEFPFAHGLVYINDGGFDVSGAPDCVANAHLIASAPDMYKLLDSIAELMNSDDQTIADEMVQKFDDIELLLKKARGE